MLATDPLSTHALPTIGIDEVGRGPLAGPVVAAAVLIPLAIQHNNAAVIERITDSKKLSASQRDTLSNWILTNCLCSISSVDIAIIEERNILQATLMAMRQAYDGLIAQYGYISAQVLVDGNANPLPHIATTIVSGDALNKSIAAASIVAKVYRDNIMCTLHELYPVYNWHQNKGYGTKEHCSSIRQHGLSPHHRLSFVRRLIA